MLGRCVNQIVMIWKQTVLTDKGFTKCVSQSGDPAISMLGAKPFEDDAVTCYQLSCLPVK